jgi:hypothetical protein
MAPRKAAKRENWGGMNINKRKSHVESKKDVSPGARGEFPHAVMIDDRNKK